MLIHRAALRAAVAVEAMAVRDGKATLAFTHCMTATSLLDSTGVFGSPAEGDRPGGLAANDLATVFVGILWAYYFSVVTNSSAEVTHYAEHQRMVQPWRSAVDEVEAWLVEKGVPDKYCPLFEELYPEHSPVGVWQVSDRLLNCCKADIADRYLRRVNARFPWDRRS